MMRLQSMKMLPRGAGKVTIATILLVFFAYNLFAQLPSSDRLKEEVERLKADSLLRFGHLSIRVVEVSSGKELYEFNSKSSLAPASNLKLLTTLSALGILGKDFTYQTKIEYSGKIDSAGVLHGNLYIVGSGDPSLGSYREISGVPGWKDWTLQLAQKVKQAGITSINGEVVVLPGIFPYNATPETWIWQDMGNYFGAPAYGINFNENLYKLYFQSNPQPGQKTTFLRTEPLMHGVQFRNEVLTGAAGSDDDAWIFLAPHSTQALISGTIPPKAGEFSIKGSIPDPGIFMGRAVTQTLVSSGIKVKGEPQVDYNPAMLNKNRKLVWTYNSPSLPVLMKYTNVYSINLYAEALLQSIAVKKYGKGSTKGGLMAIQEYWSSRGLDTTGMLLYDGSGLSPFNGISTWHFTEILGKAGRDSSCFSQFYQSFPIAGVSGTVQRIGVGTYAQNNMRVKSGTISAVLCYTGYITTRDGRLLAFSVMANKYEGKYSVIVKRLERILVAISEL
jgi:D-alanyl-D-alanine carboxypeptidase/D-alanyl-D-alanine-endopeptidase (penicillin-binding protein 4)